MPNTVIFNKDEVLVKSKELEEKITNEWKKLGGFSDTEIEVKSYFQVFASTSVDAVDISDVALAFTLAQGLHAVNATSNRLAYEESVRALANDDDFSGAIEYLEERIGYFITSPLSLYVKVSSQIA